MVGWKARGEHDGTVVTFKKESLYLLVTTGLSQRQTCNTYRFNDIWDLL